MIKIKNYILAILLAITSLLLSNEFYKLPEINEIISQKINIAAFYKNIAQKTNSYANIKKTAEKPQTYTIMVQAAADNDLFPFLGRNIKQIQQIGSNEYIKILVNYNIHRPGQSKITKRLFIEKNKITQIGPDMSLDSGDANTLVNFCQWAIQNYPSEDYVLILWNHGTGIIEPPIKRAINPSQLFNYNPLTKLVELDRSIGFLDYINSGTINTKESRGICFDDTTGNYITNQQLKEALRTICNQYLHGKKFALLACDACLMSMLEVASPLKEYAHFFVGSQEVELGTGYNYSIVLAPFLNRPLDKAMLARHIVSSYFETYSKITQDFTQSAFDLSIINMLEQNVDDIAQLLIHGLQNQKNRSVKDAIRLSRHRNFCTHFDEPTYIDLSHFYTNLINNISKVELNTPEGTIRFKEQITQLLNEGNNIISKVVIANTAGRNFKHAKGISIYFPESRIHNSYKQSEFALKTNWLNFLTNYFRI